MGEWLKYLKGNEDLRVRRTIRSIKESFLALLNEQSYDSITVTGLASRAGISKKTFFIKCSIQKTKGNCTQHYYLGMREWLVSPQVKWECIS